MKKPFSIGKITAEPGEVAKGFIPNNKNMNRAFPGNPNSPSATERAVNTFWNEVILKADFTVNLHGTDMAQVPRVVFSEHNPPSCQRRRWRWRKP